MEEILHRVALGESIKEIRTMQGLSQKALAKKAQIAQSTLVYIENGQKATNIDNLVRICEGLSISMIDLVINANMLLSKNPSDPIDNKQEQIIH